MFTTDQFIPAVNQDKLSLGEFIGYEIKRQNTSCDNPWSTITLLFDVKGRKLGTGRSKVLSLTCDAQILQVMGWQDNSQPTNEKLTIDEDGLEVVLDEGSHLTRRCFDNFIATVRGTRFWMSVQEDAEGIWSILPSSLNPKDKPLPHGLTQSATITVFLSPMLKHNFEGLCESEGSTPSTYLERLIRKILRVLR